MCRWLVYIGDDKVLLADLVTNPRNSIVQQSFSNPYLPFIAEVHKQRLNHRINGDGFGVGWYTGETDVPCVFTSIKPSWNDRNLHRLADTIWSSCIFAHVRAASPNSLIVENNCHPFQFGKILFMHNGCIYNFPKIKKQLIMQLNDQCFQSIQGSTDSEHAAAMFVQNLPQHDPYAPHSGFIMKEALLASMKQLIRLTKESSDQPEPSSLNFAVTNGEVVIATRFRNSRTEEPPSLYYTKKPRYECTEKKKCSKKNGKFEETFHSVVIASEPLSYNEDEWALVPKNHFVIITKSHKVLLEPILFDDDLFCESPVVCPSEISNEIIENSTIYKALEADTNPCESITPFQERELVKIAKGIVAGNSTIFASLTPPQHSPLHRSGEFHLRKSMNDFSPNVPPALLMGNKTPLQQQQQLQQQSPCVRKGPDGNELPPLVYKFPSVGNNLKMTSSPVRGMMSTSMNGNNNNNGSSSGIQVVNNGSVFSVRIAVDVSKDKFLLLLSLFIVILSVYLYLRVPC